MKTLLILCLITTTSFASTLTFDFNQGLQGWKVKFADYPKGEEAFHELDFKITPPGLFITGNNHSDDLYMYMTRKIGRAEGIHPGKTYSLGFRVTFHSNAPSNCLGTGGAPGESVILQGNVINERPMTFVDELNHIRTSFDHGNFISNIANGIECENDRGKYVRLVRTSPENIQVTAGKDGSLWLVLGTDSGFESTTSLFYEKIEVTLNDAF